MIELQNMKREIRKPEISTIITAYNCAPYVESAINSALSQTFKDYEIIVVDDCSVDETQQKILKYKNHKKIRYFFKKANGGNAHSKNYGINRAKGRYIAFLDGDDIWLPDKLKKQHEIMQKNPDLGIVYSSFKIINLEGNLIAENKLPNVKKPYPKILLGNFIGLSGALVKKECFDQCGLLNDQIRTHEDWDLWMRITRRFKIHLMEEPLFLYRSSKPNKITKGQIKLRRENFITVINNAFASNSELSIFFKHRCISNWYFDLAKACFFRRQILKTFYLNAMSIIHMPFQIKAYFFFPDMLIRKGLKSIINFKNANHKGPKF